MTAATPRVRKPTKPKPKSQRGGSQHPLTVAEYNALWEEYQRTQTVQDAARFAGVHYQTALKYVSGPGEPDKGFHPIGPRWKAIQEDRARTEDMTLVEFRKVELATTNRMLGVLRGEFELAAGDVRARLEAFRRAREEAAAKGEPLPRGERELGLDKLLATYEKMARLGEHLLGGPDHIHALARDPLDDLTDAEALALIARGTVPPTLRGAAAGAQRARERGEQ